MSDQPLLHRACMKIVEFGSHVLEHISSTRIGQGSLQQLINLLGILEASLLWSGPSKQQTCLTEQNGTTKTKKNHHVSSRPLPWLLFIPLLLVLRISNTALHISSRIIGREPPDYQQIVDFIQTSKREICAYKYRSRNRSAAQKSVPAEKTQVKKQVFSIISSIFLAPLNIAKNVLSFMKRCTLPQIEEESEQIVVSSPSSSHQTKRHRHRALRIRNPSTIKVHNGLSKTGEKCKTFSDADSEPECSETEDDRLSLEASNFSRQKSNVTNGDYDSDSSSTLSLESATGEDVAAEVHKERLTPANDEYYSADGSAHGTPEPVDTTLTDGTPEPADTTLTQFILAERNSASGDCQSLTSSTSLSMHSANDTFINAESDSGQT